MANVVANEVANQYLKVTVVYDPQLSCVCFTVFVVSSEDVQWHKQRAQDVYVPRKHAEFENWIYVILGSSKTLAEEFTDPLMEVVGRLSDQEVEKGGQSFFTKP